MSKLKNFSIFTLILFFATSLVLSAQVIKDDFRVNDDVIGGTNITPDIVVLENGEAIIVWRDDRNGVNNVYGQLYDDAGDPIGTNFKVSSNLGNVYEYTPAIASYGDSLLVIWEYGYGQWLLSDGSRQGSTLSLAYVNNITGPDIAVNNTGFFATWYYSISGRGQEIFIKRFDFNGDSVGPRIVINDDGLNENQSNPKIAMNDNDNFVVVWRDNRYGSSYADIYGQLFNSSGNSIGGNFRVNDNDTLTSFQYDPSCAMDGAGNFLVCWTDTRDGNANIYGQRFDNTGSPIDTNFLIINEAGYDIQYQSSCAMDSAGNFVVVWYDYRDGPTSIYGQIFDNTGSPVGSNFKISQNTGSGADYSPEVSMNDSNFVVTWYRYIDASASYDIYKRRFKNDGTPVNDELKVNDTEGVTNQTLPKIDMNTSGNAVITWRDNRVPPGIYYQRLDALGNTLGANNHISEGYAPDIAMAENSSFVISYHNSPAIFYQRFRASGDSIGSPIVISDTNMNSRFNVSVDMDSDMNAIVAWYDNRSDNYDIYAQMVDSAGDTVGGNFRVNDDAGTESQYYPDVAMSPSGKFIITWYDRRNGNYDIYGRVYNSDRTPIGANFRIDSGGTAHSYYPRAEYLPSGNYIVTWQDYRIPAGVYAQIIDTTGVFVDTNFMVSSTRGYNPAISVAPTGAFVITWRAYPYVYYDIFAQKYNPDLSPDSTSFKVNNETEGTNPDQEAPCVATNGSSIIFAWQDAKWQKGWDIAAKVFSWNQGGIEDITHEGKGLKILGVSSPILSSKEWLTISLDSPSKVDFRIINVAGIVVSSQKLAYTTPGIKKVDVDVSKLPCGPYFLSLETDKVRAVKKAVVIR